MVRVGGDRDEQDVPAQRAAGRRAAQAAAGRGDRALSTNRLLPLAWAAGCVDATSYLRLGGVFTANMTGNTVLLGLALVQGHGADAARSAVAFGGFVGGVAVSTALANARAAFTLQAAILAAVPVVGIWTGHLPLVAMSGSAMGMQAATGHHFMPPGLNLTFITGTTRAMVRRLTERALGREGEGPVGTPTAIWVAYFAGGLCGGAAAVAWRLPAFALPAAAVLATALRLPRPQPGQARHVR